MYIYIYTMCDYDYCKETIICTLSFLGVFHRNPPRSSVLMLSSRQVSMDDSRNRVESDRKPAA